MARPEAIRGAQCRTRPFRRARLAPAQTREHERQGIRAPMAIRRLARRTGNGVSDPIELDVLSGVHRALEPLGHVAEAVPRVATGVAEYRRCAGGRLRH